MEVWLPADAWNGRLQAVGNGGFQARISYGNMATGVAKGYVSTAHNTGHEGDNGDSLIGHPEKVKDWGYRAVHENVVAAKAIAAAFYGNGPKYSYYQGCSTGGRQGWVAAEYFPGDFDGLAIGDPANPMTRLQAGSIWSNLVYNKTEAGRLTRDDWMLVRNSVMQQCDAKDGLKDGLIQDPLACKFNTKTLLCKQGATDSCLTAEKIEVLDKLTRGAVNSKGEQVYPGWPAGTLVGPGGPLLSPKAQQDAVDTFRVLFQQSDWDYRTFNIDSDVARADLLGNNIMNAVDPQKLQPLFARGGKVMLYHGWYDPAITPLISIKLYQDAVKANGGLGKTYDQMRLFMVPSMGHCQGGDGPNAFDKLDPLVEWVENGKAPAQIVASHSDSTGKVDRTRPLCPYPQIAKYKGSGSIDEAQNFMCAKP
jgi:feruloyl esterase